MSDTGIYGYDSFDFGLPANERLRSMYRANEISVRAQALGRRNPFMYQRPDVLWNMAQLPLSLSELSDRGAAIYGVQVGGELKGQLLGMAPAAQRSAFYQLTPAQQMVLVQSGYSVPKREEDAWYEDLVQGVGKVAGAGFGVLGDTAKVLQLDKALNALIWASDKPAFLYRTIRTLDEEAQWAALAGAAIAVGAFFAAPVTGGASLAMLAGVAGTSLGTLGAGIGVGLAGGSLAAAAVGQRDYFNAFSKGWTWDITDHEIGERTFERSAERRANDILGDPRLVNAAAEFAEALPNNMSIKDIAYSVAGTRGDGDQVALKALQEVAAKYATEGTPAYQQLMQGMTGLLTLEQFREAVDVLQEGKISIGRDVADLFDLDHGSALHTFVSGTFDAAFVLAADPILIGTKAFKAFKNARTGLLGLKGEEAIDRFLQISRNVKGVRTRHENLAAAINAKDVEKFRRLAPEYREIYDQLVAHRDNLAASGALGNDGFTVEHFREWVTGIQKMAPIMEGFGTLRGTSDMIRLTEDTFTRELFRDVSGQIGAFVHGLSDVRSERKFIEMLKARMDNGAVDMNRSILRFFPHRTHGDIQDELLTKHLDILEQKITDAVDQFDQLDLPTRAGMRAEAARNNLPSAGLSLQMRDGRNVLVEGIEVFDPSIRSTLEELRRIYNGSISVLDLDPNVLDVVNLRTLALEGEDFKMARIAGRAFGLVPGFSKAGQIFERIGTLAPVGAWVQLEGNGATESIRRFVELAGLVDMPQWMRRNLYSTIVDQTTGAARLTHVQSFMETMLRMAGVDATPQGQQMVAEFVNSVRKAYTGGGLDITELGMHWARSGLLPSHMADGVSMPDLRMLNRAMRDGISGRMMGIIDHEYIEAFQTRVWKPAVLLRIGFIPRAAGEEMLSFVMRGGYGGLGQQLAGRSVARYDRIMQLQKGIDSGKLRLELLDAADRKLLTQGPLQSKSARYVARQIDRYGWETPLRQFMNDFAEWFRNHLDDGFIGRGNVAPFGVSPKSNVASLLAGRTVPYYDLASDAGQRSRELATMTMAERRRYALGQAYDSILFGNPLSWRRMWFKGVNDDVLAAADVWFAQHQTTMMRVVGAAHAAPVDSIRAEDSIQTKLEPDREGRVRPVKYIALRGERVMRTRASNDPLVNNAIHEETTKLFDDDMIVDDVVPEIVKLRPPDEIDIQLLADFTLEYRLLSAPREVYASVEHLLPSDWHPMLRRWLSLALTNNADAHIARRIQALEESDVEVLRQFGRNLRAEWQPFGFDKESLLNAYERTTRINDQGDEVLAFGKQTGQLSEFLYRQDANGNTAYDLMPYIPFRETVYKADAALPAMLSKNVDLFIGKIRYERIQARAKELQQSRSEWIARLGYEIEARVNPNAPALEQLLEAYKAVTRTVDEDLVALAFRDQTERLEKFIEVARYVNEMPLNMRLWYGEYARHTTADDTIALYRTLAPDDAQIEPFLLDRDGYVLTAAARAAQTRNVAWGVRLQEDEIRRLRHIAVLPDNPTNIPLYDTIDEVIEGPIKTRLRNALNRPNNAYATLGKQGVGDTGETVGKFDQVETYRGQAEIYVPRTSSLVEVERAGTFELVPVEMLSVDDVIRMMPDQAAAARYVDQIRFWLENRRAGREVAFADKFIADQITAVMRGSRPGTTSATVNPYSVTLPERLLSGDNERFMQAHRIGQTEVNNVFTIPEVSTAARAADPTISGAFPGRYRVDTNSYDERIDEWVDHLATYIRSKITSSNRKSFRARPRVLDDGSQVAAVHSRDVDGNLVPLDLDARYVDRGEAFYTADGERVVFGDNMYFMDELDEVGNDVMIPLVYPAIQDAYDIRNGRATFVLRSQTEQGALVKEGADDVVRIRRSTVSDVSEVGEGLPQWAEGTEYVMRKMNTFDKITRFGFDRVIGPSIDALARRPMAFHFFYKRYQQNLRMTQWMRNSDLVEQLDNIAKALVPRAALSQPGILPAARVQAELRFVNQASDIAEAVRRIGMVETMSPTALKWTDGQALAWIRSYEGDNYVKLLERVRNRLSSQAAQTTFDTMQLSRAEIAIQDLERFTVNQIQATLPESFRGDDFLAYLMQHVPDDIRVSMATADEIYDAIRRGADRDVILRQLKDSEWEIIRRNIVNHKHVTSLAGDYAATAAINDMLPYIDSHEVRTQMAELGKPFLPFWYAEENFMKRWVRTLRNEGPAVIRKMQILYMGLRNAGTVRTDSNGKDWFIWPGSNLLQDTISKLPGVPDLPINMMFKSPTDGLLPGFNNRVGTPQFGPLVGLPVQFSTVVFPEMETFQRNVIGEIGASQGTLEQLFPATILRSVRALFADESDQRLNSAMLTAMSLLEASGKGLPDGATPGQQDDYIRDLRSWARSVIIVQALAGWISPGSLSQQGQLEDQSRVVDELVANINPMFIELVQELGIDEGTARFLELHEQSPLAELITNPLAMTAGRTESRSGAPLPANELAVTFYDENSEYLDSMPFATPWLLPVDEAAKTAASQRAYNEQIIEGLRKSQTPEEFLNQLKYKEAAPDYFEARTLYLDTVAEARNRRDEEMVRRENLQWQNWSKMYLATHPIFKQMLEDSSTQQRRDNVITEMRAVLGDPEVPQTSMVEHLRVLMSNYDRYLNEKAMFALDGSARGKLRVERLKARYEEFMDSYVYQNPSARSFWISVLRPESALE